MSKEQIVAFLNSVKDDARNLERCIDFLYTLQRSQGSPLLEVVTILKFEKPLLYSLMKPRIQNRQGLKLLFDLTMDYEQSKIKIGMI
jgi:hypothetical protein